MNSEIDVKSLTDEEVKKTDHQMNCWETLGRAIFNSTTKIFDENKKEENY